MIGDEERERERIGWRGSNAFGSKKWNTDKLE